MISTISNSSSSQTHLKLIPRNTYPAEDVEIKYRLGLKTNRVSTELSPVYPYGVACFYCLATRYIEEQMFMVYNVRGYIVARLMVPSDMFTIGLHVWQLFAFDVVLLPAVPMSTRLLMHMHRGMVMK